MAFFAHLLIAGLFIILFYVGVNYSALNYEIKEIKALQEKIPSLSESQRVYYVSKYNKSVIRYNSLKKSIFALPLLKLCKKLNQNYEIIS
ncbi:MAG: hypothetical protein Q7V63_00640 [Gammaproteobacteria bacterium]|nr:hypothetical protein [Gammaproteobacteria bacterium]